MFTPLDDLVSRPVSTLGLCVIDCTDGNAITTTTGDIPGNRLSISGSISGAGCTSLLAPYALASSIQLEPTQR